MLQVVYLTQIYPFAHFHVHADPDGLHLDFVSHMAAERPDPESNLIIPHQHAHHTHSDECAHDLPENEHEQISESSEGCSDSPESCSIHECHHRYSSTFQLPGIRNQYYISAPAIHVVIEQYEDFENSFLAFNEVERGPPDDIVVTLRSPRPPPTVA